MKRVPPQARRARTGVGTMNASIMSARALAVVAGGVLLLAGCSQTGDKAADQGRSETASTFSNNAQDEAQIRKLADRILEMYSLQPDPRSIEIAKEIYVPDAIMPPIITDMGETDGQPWSNTGKAGWIKVMTAYNNTPVEKLPKTFEFRMQDTKVVVDGNVGALVTLLPTKITLQNNKVIDLQSRYTWVFLKVNGEWKLWHEHWSIPAKFEALIASAK